MSKMSTVDVHFTVIVIPVLHGLLSVFCEYGIIVALRFLVLGICEGFLLFLGGVCIILRGGYFGFLLGYTGVEM